MKPILIDALRINIGGGLELLNYLVGRLCQRKVDFVLLKDMRCPSLNEEERIQSLTVMSPSQRARKTYYKSHINDFHSVFCFGNIPPPIKLPTPVFTYFHNVSFLKIPKDYSLKWKIISYFKRFYIKVYVRNTDFWVAQTSYTADLMRRKLIKDYRPIEILPFYNISKQHINEDILREDYVFVGEYTNAKGQQYLLEAWRLLAKDGFNKTLHLTITDPEFCKAIEKAVSEGIPVINHGHIPTEDVYKLYYKSKATIYPSLNESLGLGIVEAVESGCDIIGVNLPYMTSISRPSYTFNACDPESIVQAVKNYERQPRRSELLIHDMIDDLINRITLQK